MDERSLFPGVFNPAVTTVSFRASVEVRRCDNKYRYSLDLSSLNTLYCIKQDT
jgi:hypothetical protein